MNYFVFRTSFFVFIFSPATESPTFPGLSPTHNITEGGTLEEMALNGFLQLGLSDMKFIRCDVSIIHRHDIRIAFYGESQLIECLGILI